MKLSAQLRAFATPFDFNTPMTRVDFWLFYLGFSLAMTPVFLVSGAGIEISSSGSWWVRFPVLAGIFGLLVYSLLILFSAMARRMRDSGFSRIGLAVLITSFTASFTIFSLAVLRAFDPAIPLQSQPVPEIPGAILPAVGLFLLSALHVFYGLISKQGLSRKDKRKPSQPT